MTHSLPLAALASFSLLAAVTTMPGCNLGGLNDGVQNPGDQPGGVQLSMGDLAVSPDGDYVVFERDDELAVGWVATGEVQSLPVKSPARLAFSAQRRAVYVTTENGSLMAVDVDARKLLWTAPTGLSVDPMVVASQDDSRIAVGSEKSVLLIDAEDGDIVDESVLSQNVVDLEILPDDQRLLVVEGHVFADDPLTEDPTEVPTSIVHVVQIADGAGIQLEVPNCSDDIIVPKHGEMALLAPTTCSQDPISVIDLAPGQEAFVRNLPGFGPVAMGPDGNMAVGFLDMNLIDETLFDDPALIPTDETRFHLMVLDTQTLEYTFHAFGDQLPRYAMTPDGGVLLVDVALSETARLFDIATATFHDIDGPAIGYEQLSFSSDSSHAYVLSDVEVTVSTSDDLVVDYQLYDLSIVDMQVNALPTDFRPRNVNIAPDDATLFLRKDAAQICIYSLATQSCERSFDLQPL
jgi:hypothetical protein